MLENQDKLALLKDPDDLEEHLLSCGRVQATILMFCHTRHRSHASILNDLGPLIAKTI